MLLLTILTLGCGARTQPAIQGPFALPIRVALSQALDCALVEAVRARDEEAAVTALQQGANPNSIYDGTRQQTCVHFGAAEDADILVHLLRFGGNPNSQDVDGLAALHIASITGNVDGVIRILLLSEPDVNLRATGLGDSTPLHLAALQGHAQIMYYLLDAGADPNALTVSRLTPLHTAAQHGPRSTVLLLLQHGADRSLRDEKGLTALDYARQRRHQAIIALLESGEAPSTFPDRQIPK